jgi:pheromone shutdown protein TraB
MADERVRLEIGFRGGQTLSVHVSPEICDELEQSLGRGDPEALALESDDGRYTVVVKMIAYVKRHVRESRVGFGAGPP